MKDGVGSATSDPKPPAGHSLSSSTSTSPSSSTSYLSSARTLVLIGLLLFCTQYIRLFQQVLAQKDDPFEITLLSDPHDTESAVAHPTGSNQSIALKSTFENQPNTLPSQSPQVSTLPENPFPSNLNWINYSPLCLPLTQVLILRTH